MKFKDEYLPDGKQDTSEGLDECKCHVISRELLRDLKSTP